jgi:hypothetical protein
LINDVVKFIFFAWGNIDFCGSIAPEIAVPALVGLQLCVLMPMAKNRQAAMYFIRFFIECKILF